MLLLYHGIATNVSIGLLQMYQQYYMYYIVDKRQLFSSKKKVNKKEPL